MEAALSQFIALGVVTNIPLLRSVMRHPQFVAGDYDTAFLERNPADAGAAITNETRIVARALSAWASQQPSGPASPLTAPVSHGKGNPRPDHQPMAINWTAEAPVTQNHGEMLELHPAPGEVYRYQVELMDGRLTFGLVGEFPEGVTPTIALHIESGKIGEGLCRTESGGSYPFAWAWVGQELHLWLNGDLFVFQPSASRRRGRSAGGEASADVFAPMPGTVLEVLVSEGDRVEQNQTVVIMESMKMELVITASRSGVIRRVSVQPGQQVERGMRLLELAPECDAAVL